MKSLYALVVISFISQSTSLFSQTYKSPTEYSCYLPAEMENTDSDGNPVLSKKATVKLNWLESNSNPMMTIVGQAPSWSGTVSGFATTFSSNGGGSFSSYAITYGSYSMVEGPQLATAIFYPQLLSADSPLLSFRNDFYTCVQIVSKTEVAL